MQDGKDCNPSNPKSAEPQPGRVKFQVSGFKFQVGLTRLSANRLQRDFGRQLFRVFPCLDLAPNMEHET
jgi:hypothetical protein